MHWLEYWCERIKDHKIKLKKKSIQKHTTRIRGEPEYGNEYLPGAYNDNCRLYSVEPVSEHSSRMSLDNCSAVVLNQTAIVNSVPSRGSASGKKVGNSTPV